MSHVARSALQVGTLIQRTRKQRGLTQTDLANLAGMRQEMVSKIETGHEGAKLSSVFALFAALDLELLIDTRSGRALPNIEDIF